MGDWNIIRLGEFGDAETAEWGLPATPYTFEPKKYDAYSAADYFLNSYVQQHTVAPANLHYSFDPLNALQNGTEGEVFWYVPQPVETNLPRLLYERIQKAQVKNRWADAGRKLEELQNVYQWLSSWAVEKPLHCYIDPYVEVDRPSIDPACPNPNLSLPDSVEEYIGLLESVGHLLIPVNPVVVRCLRVTKKDLVKQMLRATGRLIRETADLIFAGISAFAIFCGLSWPKRAWYLLHGSHPPKPELGLSGLAFGCA